jgi:hypothetical protein
MVGRHDNVFYLKRLCVQFKGKDHHFSVKRQCFELVGQPGKRTAPYPRHSILGTFRGEVPKEISTNILRGTTGRGISCLSTGKQLVEEYEIRFMELVKYVSYMDNDQ